MSARALLGKNVLITGGSRGLGYAVARSMRRAGANLLLSARSREALGKVREELLRDEPGDGQVEICAADLRHADAPALIVDQARRLWPRLDVLVNNAAMQGPIGKIWENDWDEWKATLAVDLLSPIALCRLCLSWMRETGGGAIINLSGGGATGPRPHFSAYATAKAGLVRFSETVAAEASADGIRVNCVAPGAMNTEMLQAVLQSGAEKAGAEEYRRAVEQAKSGGAPPDEAGALCVFLASDEAAGISGKLISAIWDPWRSLGERLGELRGSDIYTLRRIVPADRGKDWK